MGLAMAAELNGYPGPIHALELADRLELTGDQKLRLQQLLRRMKAEAIAVGEKLITREQAPDQEFSGRTMTPECVSAWNKDPVFGVIGIQSGPR